MRLSERFRTPYVALLAQGLWSSLLIAVPGSELSQLFNYFGFASWLFYALTAVSSIGLRYKRPYCDYERPFRMVRRAADPRAEHAHTGRLTRALPSSRRSRRMRNRSRCFRCRRSSSCSWPRTWWRRRCGSSR